MEILGTNPIWLGEIVERVDVRKSLFIPGHQKLRWDAWLERQKWDWYYNTILPAFKKGRDTGRTPIVSGFVITYELAGDKLRIKYLNDGANRTYHSIRFLRAQFKALATTDKGKSDLALFEQVIHECQIYEQSKLFDGEPEAVNDYINANSKGTVATPYELLGAEFVAKLPDYETVWTPIFEKIQVAVNKNLSFLGFDPDKLKRETLHKFKRDNLAHFVRFLGAYTNKWKPCVTNKVIDWNNPRHREVERNCLQLFLSTSVEEIKEKLEEFALFVEDKVALYRQIRAEKGIQFLSQTSTSMRWWITFAIWHHNNGFKDSTLRKFTEKYLDCNGGGTTLLYKKASQPGFSNTNTKLQDLCNLTGMYKAFGLKPTEVEIIDGKRKKPKPCVPGFVQSHFKSFAANGDGETLPENRRENAKRSARDAEPAEVKRIRKANAKTPKA